MSKKTLMDFFQLRKKSINPKKYPDSLFTVYSLPAFDNHKTPEIIKGALIESNKDIMAADTILFNKLNIRFKRVWNIKEIQDNAVCSWEFLQIEPKNCDQDFLYYFLLSDSITTFLDGASGWTSHSHSRIKPEDLLNIKVNFPPINKQKEIGSILSAIDSKIEINNKINAELESMAKAIYDYWFVQFDFPDENGKPYKSSGGKMVWNKELKRDIPLTWNTWTVWDFCKITRGVTYSANDVTSFRKNWTNLVLRATNINGQALNFDNPVYVDSGLISENQKLQKYDLLMVMSSGSKEHVWKNAVCYSQSEPSFWAFCSRLKLEERMKFYLISNIQSLNFKKHISNVCLGTNINNLNNNHISDFRIIIPNEVTLKNFESLLHSVHEQIGNTNSQNLELSNLRDWLLPMLMNGQVTVSK